MTVDWNEENTNMLKTCYAENLSASQIAAKIPYATRNAVIGKINRLGLRVTVKTVRKPRSKQAHAAKPKPAKTGVPYHLRRFQMIKAGADPGFAEAPNGSVGVSFSENTGCGWPLDSGTFCGLPLTAARKPYCPAHAEMARRKA